MIQNRKKHDKEFNQKVSILQKFDETRTNGFLLARHTIHHRRQSLCPRKTYRAYQVRFPHLPALHLRQNSSAQKVTEKKESE